VFRRKNDADQAVALTPEPQPDLPEAQAPKGREGLYLGYAHMNTFFAWLFGFVFAGLGVALLLYHSVTDTEQEIRRMYGLLAGLLLALRS
jgi:hypothetical protein